MKPEVQLTGSDGNAFAIIGTVARALRNVGMKAEATKFTNKAQGIRELRCGASARDHLL